MNANVMKTNNGKLLAAIVAMLMIVCAVAVVASPTQAEPAEAPVFSGDNAVVVNVTKAVDIDDLETLFDGATTAAEKTNYYEKGVLTVPAEGMIINLSANMGSEETPLDITIDLDGDLKIVSTNGSQVWIKAVTGSGKLIDFGADNTVFQIDGNVIVNLDSAITVGGIFSNRDNGNVTAAVYVTGGATLNVAQEGSGSTWVNGDNDKETFLVVTGTSTTESTVKFTGTSSIQGVVLMATNAAISISDSQTTGMVLKNGSVLDNSSIVVDGAEMNGFQIKGTVSFENGSTADVKDTGKSTINTGYDGIGFSGNGGVLQIDATSSVTTNSIGLVASGTTSATIEGAGTFSGNLSTGTKTAATFTLDGITANDVSIEDKTGVSIDIGSTGVSATGEVNLTNATVSGDGKLVATNGSTVTVAETSGKLPEYLVTVPGANVNGSQVTSDGAANKVTVTDADQLVNYAKNDGMDITIDWEGFKTLTSDLIIGDNTKITSTGGVIRLADSGTAADGTSFKIVKEGDGEVSIKVDSYTGTERSFFELTLNGKYTIQRGSVDLVDVSLNDDNEIVIRQGEIIVTGNLNGNLVFDATNASVGSIVTFKDFTVNAGSVVTFDASSNVSYQTEGNFYLYGSLISEDPVNLYIGSADDAVASKFTGYSGAVVQQNVTLITNKHKDTVINLDESLKNMEISIDITGDPVYSQLQTVTIVTSLDITAYSSLTIMGQLIINEGVTLNIQDNAELIINSSVAKMIVNGTITVEGDGKITVIDADSVDVAGSISSEGAVYINSKVTVEENGTIYIDDAEKSILAVSEGLTVNAGGSVEVRGQMAVKDITNKGTVTLNGATLTSATVEGTPVTACKISMAADGAVVDIKSFVSKTDANSLTISDEGLVLYEKKSNNTKVTVGQSDKYNGYDYSGKNIITLSGEDMLGLRNLTVTESVTSDKDSDDVTYYIYGMNIAGTVAVADERDDPADGSDLKAATYTINVSGVKIDVAADTTLTLGAGVTLSVAANCDFNVDGTVYAVAGNKTNGNPSKIVNNGGTINVAGMIEILKDNGEIGDYINAAHYEADIEGVTHCYYTTLATAIENGAEEIYVMGEIEILENLTIPTGVTIRADDNNARIQIGDADHRDVVVTVTAGATVRGFAGGINVDATLEFQDIKDSKSGNVITSDVQVNADPARTYTNIYTALNNAESGETVTITRDGSNVVLTDDIEVKTGVTLSIPNSRTVQVNNGVTLTVNGTIQKTGDIVGEVAGEDSFNPMIDADTQKDADDYATIIVNGAIRSLEELQYTSVTGSTGEITEKGYYIAGAYYNVVDSTGDYWYVTPVTQAAAVSNNVEGGIITVYGDNTVADVAFTGDADQAVYVNVQAGATLTAGTVTLSYAEITLLVNGTVNSAFTGTIASAVGSVELVNATNFTVVDALDSDDAEYIAVSGVPAKADADGVDATMTVASGNVSVVGDLTIYTTIDSYLESFEIASGATMTVTGTDGDFSADSISVDGTLVAIDNGTVDVTGVLTVRGTFTVAEKTDDNDAGSANIRILFVGIAQDEDYGWYTDASAATVNADNLGANLQRIVVSADSTISGDLTKNMSSTEFYVEDALWLTVYVTNSNGNFINDYRPGVPTESVVTGWNNADGKKVENETIGTTGYEQVYAQVNYNVYDVVVYIDNGIGDVAIDGQLLVSNGSGGYYLPNGQKLTSGQHTITYTLKPNFEGTPTLVATGDVATVSGLTFTLSGGYYDFDAAEFNTTTLTLSGTTPSDTTVVIEGGNNGGSDMGLTDYLLIVLVILIVIMAIIVALRLMRS